MKQRNLNRICLLSLALIWGQLVPLHGQATPFAAADANVAKNQAARSDAANLLKSGDSPGALAKLRGGVIKGATRPSEDVQVAAALASIAKSLAAEQHAAASGTASLAVSEAEKAQGSASYAERAYLAAMLGDLYENNLGNRGKAREQYLQALAIDPKKKDASAGLARLARVDALIQAKARENSDLRASIK